MAGAVVGFMDGLRGIWGVVPHRFYIMSDEASEQVPRWRYLLRVVVISPFLLYSLICELSCLCLLMGCCLMLFDAVLIKPDLRYSHLALLSLFASSVLPRRCHMHKRYDVSTRRHLSSACSKLWAV